MKERKSHLCKETSGSTQGLLLSVQKTSLLVSVYKVYLSIYIYLHLHSHFNITISLHHYTRHIILLVNHCKLPFYGAPTSLHIHHKGTKRNQTPRKNVNRGTPVRITDNQRANQIMRTSRPPHGGWKKSLIPNKKQMRGEKHR